MNYCMFLPSVEDIRDYYSQQSRRSFQKLSRTKSATGSGSSSRRIYNFYSEGRLVFSVRSSSLHSARNLYYIRRPGLS